MTKIQASRLLTLAWFLRTQVPRRHFKMRSIAESGNLSRKADLNNPSCGTSACALGWATAVWPDVFGLRRFYADVYVLERTPKEEAFEIEQLVKEKDWVYANAD